MENKKNNWTQFQHKPLRFMFFVMKQNKWLGIWAILCIIFARLLQSGGLYLVKLIIDAFNTYDGNMQRIYTVIIIFLSTLFFSSFLYRISGFIALKWITKMEIFSAQVVMDYLFWHSAKYFSNRLSGKLQNKIFNIANAINAILPTLLWNIFNTFLQILVLTILAFISNWIIGVVFLGFVFISLVYNLAVSFKTIQYSKETADKSSQTRSLSAS